MMTIIREERFHRQVEMGIIPANSTLPRRNPGDPVWTELSDHERAVYTRFMAAFAGFLEDADEQIDPNHQLVEGEQAVRQYRDIPAVRQRRRSRSGHQGRVHASLRRPGDRGTDVPEA